jgi:chromosome segregation ATPase
MKQQMLEAEVKELKGRIEALTAERDALKVQNEYQEKMIWQADARGDYWKASAENAEAELDAQHEACKQVQEAIEAAYIAGAMDVHHNWQADRAPDFSEAARDYSASQPEPVAGAAQKGDQP